MRVAPYDGSRCLDAVQPRHLQVHEHNVGEQLLGEMHRLLARGGLPNELNVFGSLQQARHALTEQLVVVGQEHPGLL